MKKEQMGSLAWLALAVYIGVETWRNLPLGDWHDPGPGFFPMGAGLFLGSLAALNLLKAVFDKTPEDPGPWYPRKRWKTIVLIMLALAAYVFLMEPLGFVPSTFLLLLYLFRSAEPQRWWVSIGGSVLISLATWVVFEVWLKTQLPHGFLGF